MKINNMKEEDLNTIHFIFRFYKKKKIKKKKKNKKKKKKKKKKKLNFVKPYCEIKKSFLIFQKNYDIIFIEIKKEIKLQP